MTSGKNLLQIAVLGFLMGMGACGAYAESPSAYSLDAVVVTATRTESTVKNTPASVSVVTAEEIAKRNVRTVTEAIAMLPGVYDARPQGMSDVGNSIQIRGYSEDSILVLYDGMPLNDAYDGGVNWSAVSINDVKKIELVRGAASSLYGGRAVGAVINIESKDPDKDSAKAYMSYGSHSTWKRGAAISQKLTDRLSASFGYENRQTDGYLKKYSYASKGTETSPSGTVGTGAVTTEKYSGSTIYLLGTPGTGASKDNTYNLKLKYKFDKNKSLTYRYTHDNFKYYAKDPVSYIRDAEGNPIFEGSVLLPDGKYYNFGESDFTDYYGRRKVDIHALSYKDDDNKIIFNLGVTNVKDNGYSMGSDFAGTGAGTDARYPNKSYKSDFQKEWDMGRHTLVAGFDIQRDSMDYIKSKLAHWKDKNSVTSETSRMGGKNLTAALFVQDEYKINDQWNVYGGFRFDHYRKYNGYYRDASSSIKQKNENYNELSPKLSFEYKPQDTVSYYISYGHSFNAPTLYEMYRNDPGYGYIANPDLDPETTNTFEIGMKKQIGTKTNLTMSVYHAKTKDMIIAVKRADGKRWYVNQDQARRIGAELDVNHTFGQFFSAYANYSYEQAKDENGDRIYSIPRHIFHSGIQYNREKWNAYLEGQYISGRNEPGNVAHRLYSEDAVFTMNLGVNVQVCKGAVLGLTVNNLLDKEYWAWQKAAGRTYTVSLQYEI